MKLMQLFIEVIIFVLGMCCGSFVNMWVYRTAINFELIKIRRDRHDRRGDLAMTLGGRSFCDYCGRQLSWYENIPVVSWMILRGKTKCCHHPLPQEYPLIELLMGVIFFITYELSVFSFEIDWKFILSLAVVTVLIYEAVFDLKYMILPQQGIYLLIGVGLILAAGSGDWITKLISGLAAGLFVWILTKIKIRGNQAMGDGDVTLALFMGIFLGFPNIIVAFYLAFILGAVVGVILLLFRIRKRTEPIPFGPFLIGSVLIASWWGDSIVKLFI